MVAPADVTLYTRAACPLCDRARVAIDEAVRRFGITVHLQEVDIDYDLDLLAKFNDDVPVIYIGGAEAFRHRVDPSEFAWAVRRGGLGDGSR
jgi:glutaredoxin